MRAARDRRGAGGSRHAGAFALVLVLAAAGCGRPRPAAERSPAPLAVQVYADTGRAGRLSVRPPAARVWLARVTPVRPGPLPPPPPEPAPEPPPPDGDEGPGLEVAPGLLPPVLRAPVRLHLPPGRRAAGAWVDLEVRVDESGAVDAAEWRGGSGDTALVESARRCALAMRFHPALRAGEPVAVWCRQRFDFRTAAPSAGDAPGR